MTAHLVQKDLINRKHYKQIASIVQKVQKEQKMKQYLNQMVALPVKLVNIKIILDNESV